MAYKDLLVVLDEDERSRERIALAAGARFRSDRGRPLDPLRLGFEVFGQTKPGVPDRGIAGPLGEFAIPGRQFAQLLWFRHCQRSHQALAA